MNDFYKHLYIKYKTKYLNLKKYKIQVGGNYDFEKLKEMYLEIPESGLYSKNKSVEKFEKFCKFLVKKTENEPEIRDIKRKVFLENKKLTNTREYIKLLEKIKNRGN